MATAASTNIYDPDIYIAGPPHETFDALRRTNPGHWQAAPEGRGYWAAMN
jgi:hypothetical protein